MAPTVRIRLIDGSPEALKQVLNILGVPVAEFKFYGRNSSSMCDRTVHAPHEVQKGTSYCTGRPGFAGEQMLLIVASERSLDHGSAKGISFLLPRNVFPRIEDQLMKAGAGQGPGYTEGGAN